MGLEKDRQIKAADDWIHICKAREEVCSRCGQVPTKDEYFIYKQSGLCGHCAHILNNDD